MESAAQSKGIVLYNAIQNRTSADVETDAEILQTILECFVSNAINYSGAGQKIIVDALEETNAIVFSVHDNGIGIPQEAQKHIFERFYRASNARVLKPEGTGLGLYIAFTLAEKLGGKVSFTSEEGKGSTFYLSIPKIVK